MKLVAVVALMAMAGASHAAIVRIQESAVGSATYDLRPGDLSALAFGATAPNLSDAALDGVHQRLALESINTDDIVTVLAAETDDGLALFHLVDGRGGAFSAFDARLDFVGQANDADGSGVTAWVNDAGQELFQSIDANPIAATMKVHTTHQWDTNAMGDGEAFSRLTLGDNGSSVFVPLTGFGTHGVSRGFQFLSFENGSWVVAHAGQFNPGPSSTSFDWQVIPAPASALLLGIGLATTSRRRR